MTRLLYALPLLLLFALAGCSDSNSDAPPPGVAHPAGWIQAHAAEALSDLAGCQVCHGLDFAGSGAAVSCFNCHQTGPPFTFHPGGWVDVVADHQAFAQTISWTTCATAVCHGTNLRGGNSVPSCFNVACHRADGHPPAPHAVPFTDPVEHGSGAKASQVYCRNCHGRPQNNFEGGFVADPAILNKPLGACTACHPAAKAHPTNWQGTNEDIDPTYASTHRTINLATVNVSCALCHKTDAAGAGPLPGAPSCFSASFTNPDGSTTGCHAGGPGTVPHALPFVAPATHGPPAKSDLGFCQECHGTPGTVQFSGGIASTACSTCHPAAGAHPTRWQGTNDNTPDYLSSHRTAGAFDTACAICHNTEKDAPGPHSSAPSCFSAGFTNADGSATACHPGGPGAPHAIPFTDPSLHGPVAKAPETNLSYCQTCHGEPGSIDFAGGSSGVACSQAACHPAAGAHPTRWQGTNDNTPAYLSTHRNSGSQNVACIICHDFTQGRTPPNPAAPSCFSASITNADGTLSNCHATGPGAPHPLPFKSSALHGPEALADLTFCRNCHATPFNAGPGGNPRFNVPLGSLARGCEDCHNAFTAHPVPWLGATPNRHKTAGNIAVACALCHGAALDGAGGVGPACTNCHTAGLPTVLLNCTSCHNVPPNGFAPAGNLRPNREGAHAEHNALPKVAGVCGTCHNGAGTNTNNHFDTTEPATVAFLSAYNAKTGAATFSTTARTCSNVSCHGGQTTPVWLSGVLDVNTQCTSCHQAGTTQYNSYTDPDGDSHTFHLGRNDPFDGQRITCTDCHNTTTLATAHFTNLDTANMEGPAGATIGGADTRIGAGSYTDSNNSCSPQCHGNKTW